MDTETKSNVISFVEKAKDKFYSGSYYKMTPKQQTHLTQILGFHDRKEHAAAELIFDSNTPEIKEG